MTKFLYNLISIALFIYIIIFFYIYIIQRKLIYRPNNENLNSNKIDKINFNYNEVQIITNEGIKLKALFHEKDLINKKTLIFFHGNEGPLDNRNYKLNAFSKLNINFIIVAWRGFSYNEGNPTEKGLYQDAKSTIEWIKNKGVKEKNIILYGESLGSSIVIEVAQHKNFAGIILEAPFTSLVEIAQKNYPFFPVQFILQDKFETIKKIKNIKSPILIMHSESDKTVPFYMGKKLFDEAPTKKYGYFPYNDNHMMTFNSKLIFELQKFIKKLH